MVIYKTTNLLNGKIYIGKDSKNDPKYLGSGVLLKRSILKYGSQNFKKEILQICTTQNELNEQEIYWIQFYNSSSRKHGYNLTLGGTGGDTWTNCENPERIRPLIESGIKWMQSKEGRESASSHANKLWSLDSHRKLMSNKMTGREITWKDKISSSIIKWHQENPISEKTRKKFIVNGKKNKGRELKKLDLTLEKEVVRLVSEGMKRIDIESKLGVSKYLIRRVIKKLG